jgi:hypothetical protein
MRIKIIENEGVRIAEVQSDGIVIHEIQDALDLMADVNCLGADKVILSENQITPDFFDLKTRLAGEILQKFSQYRVQLAIVGDFTKYKSKSLKDFIFESNRHGHISFVSSLEEAKTRLAKKY